MSLKIDKIYTENPYVDELVYYTKLLGVDTILKNETDAVKNETLESIKAADIMIACRENVIRYWRFNDDILYKYINENVLRDVCGITSAFEIDSYMVDLTKIPEKYHDTLTEYLKECYLNDYVELNNYYRMLNGLPNVGVAGIKVSDYYYDDVMDINKCFHELQLVDLKVLDSKGILERVYNDDPTNRGYVLFLTKKIDPYVARRTAKFEPVYIPDIESSSIREMYIDKLLNNRDYVMATVYSEAYKYNSDYYDNFICVFIVLITMIDIISRVQEFITRKEIFDFRSCKYLFQSFGVPYFAEIPLRFQIAMVKNIHTLLKYKSTAKCMVDIASLFGYKNVKLFKYYLLRDRKTSNATDDFFFSTDKNGNEALEDEYELKFLKMPLEGDLDEYIRIGSNHIDYDEITLSDTSWDGGLDHEEVKRNILKEQFNYSRTKYISIDTVYDIAKMSMHQSYFFGLLFDNHIKEELVTVKLPFLDSNREFKLSDVFTLLTVLTYRYKGMEDRIMDTQSKILYVNGFNFKADLAELATYMKNHADFLIKHGYLVGSTADAWNCLNKFIIPDEPIPSFNQLMKLFVNNLDIRDLLVSGMEHADNVRIYDIFKKLYDSLMITELTFDFYKNPETGDFYREIDKDTGEAVATYAEFLRHRDSMLYNTVSIVDSYDDQETKIQYIATLMDNIVYSLEQYIDKDEFQGIFAYLPAASMEAIKKYISTIINFYKSFKVDFLGLNTVYYIDDKLDGIVKLIDDMDLSRYFEKEDYVKLYSFISMMISMSREERIELIEKLHMDIRTYIELYHKDKVKMSDKLGGLTSIFTKDDFIEFLDKYFTDKVHLTKEEFVMIFDDVWNLIVNFTLDENVSIKDKVYVITTRAVDPNNFRFYGRMLKGYFVIPDITIKNNMITVYDDRIYDDSVAIFVLNTTSMVDGISCKCSNGKCVITVSDSVVYPELYGRLLIYDGFPPNA